jgi:hypothetical protein
MHLIIIYKIPLRDKGIVTTIITPRVITIKGRDIIRFKIKYKL